MTFRVFELAIDLVTAINAREWNKASDINDKIKTILDTYKCSC